MLKILQHNKYNYALHSPNHRGIGSYQVWREPCFEISFITDRKKPKAPPMKREQGQQRPQETKSCFPSFASSQPLHTLPMNLHQLETTASVHSGSIQFFLWFSLKPSSAVWIDRRSLLLWGAQEHMYSCFCRNQVGLYD